jgi:hypothetical protein
MTWSQQRRTETLEHQGSQVVPGQGCEVQIAHHRVALLTGLPN